MLLITLKCFSSLHRQLTMSTMYVLTRNEKNCLWKKSKYVSRLRIDFCQFVMNTHCRTVHFLLTEWMENIETSGKNTFLSIMDDFSTHARYFFPPSLRKVSIIFTRLPWKDSLSTNWMVHTLIYISFLNGWKRDRRLICTCVRPVDTIIQVLASRKLYKRIFSMQTFSVCLNVSWRCGNMWECSQ